MEKQKQLASKSKTTSGSGAPVPLQSAIVSTAGKPPRAQPARAHRPSTSDVQAEGGEIIAVGDESVSYKIDSMNQLVMQKVLYVQFIVCLKIRLVEYVMNHYSNHVVYFSLC
jgi:hypothetical protein